MTVSALVVTLAEDDDVRTRALLTLAADPRVTCGEPQGSRLPVVIETESLIEAKKLVEDLVDVPGVTFVDVISVDFENEVA